MFTLWSHMCDLCVTYDMTIAFVRTVLLYIIVLERCAAVGEINHDVRMCAVGTFMA